MNTRLTWSQIKDLFEGQWVELVDCQWDWDRAYPKLACVRNFSSDRSSLLAMIAESPELDDTVVLYLGAAEFLIERDSSVVSL